MRAQEIVELLKGLLSVLRQNFALYTIMAVLLSGCGGGGGGGGDSVSAGCGSKDLFSNWTYQTTTLSLAGFEFGQSEVYQIQFSGGEICLMDVVINGNQCSGSIGISNSTYSGGGPGDPGCSIFNGPNTYTKSASGLEVCDVSSCAVYQ